MITQNDIDWVLRLAEDELEHLENDAERDEHSRDDYLFSKAALERVREYLTTEGRIKPW